MKTLFTPAAFLGVPYMPLGDTRAGADCWGFFRLVMHEVHAVEVPMTGVHPDDLHGVLSAFKNPAHPGRAGWHPVCMDDAQSADALLFARRPGWPDHVGILVDGGRVLHCVRGMGSVCEPLERAMSRGLWREVSAWRHDGGMA